MIKLMKYLKKSVFSIVLVIALLVLQAGCDLSLPDYTSKIVNVGISQSGIEHVSPEVIRKSEMDHAFLFMNEKDQAYVKDHYQQLDPKDYDDYKDQDYKALKNESLYELKDVDSEQREKLDQVFEKPLLMVSMFNSDTDETKAIKQGIMANVPEPMKNLNIYEVLTMLPEENRKQMMTEMDKKLKDMPDNIVEGGDVQYLKTEYQAIGLNVEQMQSNYILLSGAKMLGIALLSMIATVLVGLLGSRVAARFARDLRKDVFQKVVGFSNAEFTEFSTASLITRSTNDIQQIQMLMVMLLRIVFYAPILGVGGVLKVLNTNSSMAWIIAVAVLAIMALVVVMFAVAMPKFKKLQALIDKLNLVTREILTGLPVIRAFSRGKYEEKRFDKANRDLTKTNLFVNRVMSFMMPAMMFMMNGIAILIVYKGAHAIDGGTMQVGDMMAFIQYTMQIIMAFLMISMVSIMLPRASVSATRIKEVLETPLSVKDPKHPKKFDPAKRGYVEFKDVSFRYPDADENIINNVSFVAKPGETTAFIGSTGSGKSTLINLIPRFFDVTAGKILVDGVNIKEVTQHDLRSRIGYVPQTGVLFSGTIDSNLRYGKKEATKKQLEKACEIAQATEFIESKPEKMNTEVSQGGTNVSGGQKQRLSIARAIAVDPEIYIFDDSFSALDFKTDAALRRALKKETKESTVLIVAQRISTIMHAEQIVVMDEGNVVGIGTHEELLKTCDVYKQLALSQLGKEELENGK